MAATSTIPKRRGKTKREGPWARTFAWIRAHAQEYPGCWLAVAGDQLIAADPDVEVVLQAVEQAQCEQRPLLHYQSKPLD